MKDLLGRDVEQGDLVVVKPTGRNSSGLAIGVYYGKSVRFRTGKVATYNQFFKVINPDGVELEIQNEILEQIRKEEIKLKTKAISFKELEIGRLYETKNGSKEFYLGEGKFKSLSKVNDGEWKNKRWRNDTERGYLTVGYPSYVKYIGYNYDTFEYVKARKTKPQFIKALDEKIDILDNNMVFETEGEYANNIYKYLLKIDIFR